jgi:hypothetical protein
MIGADNRSDRSSQVRSTEHGDEVGRQKEGTRTSYSRLSSSAAAIEADWVIVQPLGS